MNTFNQRNLENIRAIFAEKTGVALNARRSRPRFITAAVAAVVLCCLSVTALAGSLFSSLSGDDLSLGAVYEGSGVVSIHVENRSDKLLRFQRQLKLMRWSTSEEIQPVSGEVTFSETEFPAHSSGQMTVDLSRAYDIDMLEQPLVDDHYYFVLTNNGFAFGQDWMCTVTFAEPVVTPRQEPTPTAPAEADPALTEALMEELRPYFEGYTGDPGERKQQAEAYLALCEQLLGQVEGNIVPSVSPMELTVREPGEEVVFDSTVPAGMQLQLTGLHHRVMDGYGKVVGRSEEESALVLSAYIPHRQGEVDGGADIPLLYIFTYEADSIQSPQDYAFIRGRLLTFEELEPYRIYEDGQYVCYDASSLFYSDLRRYVESMVSQRSDVYFDEQVWARVESIHAYYSENMGALLGYRESR